MATHRKTLAQLEQELAQVREERDQLREVLMHAPWATALMRGPEHTFSLVNRALQTHAGDRPMLELNFREAFPELADGAFHATLDAVFGGGEAVEMQEADLFQALVGRPEFRDLTYRPLHDAEGAVTGIAVYGHDVTEKVAIRRQLEFLFEELRLQAEELNRSGRDYDGTAARLATQSESQERLAEKLLAERVIQHVPAGIAYLDRQLVFQWLNPTFRELFKTSEQSMVGRPLAESFPLASDLLGPAMETLLAEGTGFDVKGLLQANAVDGAERKTYWDIRCQAVPGNDGRVLGVLVFATDVTPRVENERLQHAELEAMKRADALKGELMDIVAYELRAPLHVLMGFGSILRKELAGGLTARQHEYLSKMLVSADALARVVDEVMDMAQIKAGMMYLSPSPTDFEGVLDGVTGAVRALAEARHLTIEMQTAAPLPLVFVDERRIRQALLQILENAVTFTPPAGTIRLRTRQQGERLVCEVHDSGAGISPAQLTEVFEPFMRGDMSANRRTGGVGLGLPIARALIEAHGGTLEVESTPGQGACFRLTLPTLDSAELRPVRLSRGQAGGA